MYVNGKKLKESIYYDGIKFKKDLIGCIGYYKAPLEVSDDVRQSAVYPIAVLTENYEFKPYFRGEGGQNAPKDTGKCKIVGYYKRPDGKDVLIINATGHTSDFSQDRTEIDFFVSESLIDIIGGVANPTIIFTFLRYGGGLNVSLYQW